MSKMSTPSCYVINIVNEHSVLRVSNLVPTYTVFQLAPVSPYGMMVQIMDLNMSFGFVLNPICIVGVLLSYSVLFCILI